MTDLISIIIPVFNIEKYLDRCIKTVINQTYSNIEIIIVDDGSTDKTLTLALSLQEKDQRIKVISQNNMGVSAARNIGLNHSTGNYIGFIDGDDMVASDMFELLLRNIKKYNAEISHCGYKMIKDSEKIEFYNTNNLIVHNKKAALHELLKGSLVEPSVCTKLYKRHVLRDVRFNEEIKINEDLLFNVLAFKKTNTSVFHDVTKYQYLYRQNSSSKKEFQIEDLIHLNKASEKIITALKNEGLTDALNKFNFQKKIYILKKLYSNNLEKNNFAKELHYELKNISSKSLNLKLKIQKYLFLKSPLILIKLTKLYHKLKTPQYRW